MNVIDPHPGDPDAVPLDQLYPRRHEPLPDQRPLFGEAPVAKRKPKTETPPETDLTNGTATGVAEAAAGETPTLSALVDGHGDQWIDIDLIDPSPYQTRRRFDQEGIERMAESLKTHGQLQNLIVRCLDDSDRLQLICGERRWRAGKLAGLSEMRAQVIACTDDEARELVIIENLERENVSAIEEAAGFEQLLQSGKYNQTTLAERLKCTPGHISNRLRLLKLPEAWQQKIIDGSLPPTHARALASWVHRPVVLDALAAIDSAEDPLAGYSVEDLTEMLTNLVYKHSRSLQVGNWDGPKFALTDEIRAELDVEEVPKKYQPTGKEPRAFNAARWDELQAEAEAARQVKRDADRNATESDDDEDEDAPTAQRSPTYSELTDWVLRNHFQKHVGSVLAGHLKADGIPLRMLIAAGTNDTLEDFTIWLQQKAGLDVDTTPDESDAWFASHQLQISPKNFPILVHEFVTTSLAGGGLWLGLPLLMAICDDLKVKPLAKWQPDEELLNRCSEVQLRELFTDAMAPEKSVKKWGRERLIKEALASWPAGYLPILLTPNQLKQPTTIGSGTDDDSDDDDQDDDDE